MWKNLFEKHECLGKNHLKNLLQQKKKKKKKKNGLKEIDFNVGSQTIFKDLDHF